MAARAMKELYPYMLGMLIIIAKLCCSDPMELDVSKLNEPPENLRARELNRENIDQVKKELTVKGKVGARLELICCVPPVPLIIMTDLFVFCFLGKFVGPAKRRAANNGA